QQPPRSRRQTAEGKQQKTDGRRRRADGRQQCWVPSVIWWSRVTRHASRLLRPHRQAQGGRNARLPRRGQPRPSYRACGRACGRLHRG
ncbi:MAG: hypothetical protein FJ290_32390, partial [Planctomycetes bacterium]|nr:hypothetical protein [Planctomycetota bacterium]